MPEEPTIEEVERGLTFLGLVGMIDPPRPEAKAAVAVCRQAGIKPVMITGDHVVTASAIARELGILQEGDRAITGAELDAMSAELIQNFCRSTLSYQPSLSLLGGSTSATLEVEIKRIDPEELMEQMGFNEDARQWAGTLFETLKDSGALEKYGGYFSAYQPDYSGDGSYSGDIQHGTSYDNDIDISRFVSPSTKNNLDLAAYAVQAWENNWGYVWGTYGNILTESLFAYKKQQYPDGVGNYADFIEANWLGRRTADCIGLIKGYAWLDASTMRIGYAANGMPDYGADQMYQAAKNAGIQGTDYGTVSSMPEIPGLMLWKSGHAGVYIGGGYAIEAMGMRKGVVKTEVSGRGWQGWCKLPYIDYLEVE